MESPIRHMLVEAFNEYELSHDEWSNVIHLGRDTFDDVMQVFYETESVKTEEDKEKLAAAIKASGTVMGRQVVVHEGIPRMMIADRTDGNVRNLRYAGEFLFKAETIRRLAATAEQRYKNTVLNRVAVVAMKEASQQLAAPELADTKG